MESDNTVKKGWYKHFKGGVYEVLGVGVHTETEEDMVVYIHKTDGNPGGFWLRPLEMFLGDKVMEDGTKVQRFVFVGEDKPEE